MERRGRRCDRRPVGGRRRDADGPRRGRAGSPLYRLRGCRPPAASPRAPTARSWFLNSNANAIGRITTTGTFTYFADPGHTLGAGRHHGRAGRRAVVHEPRRFDRPHRCHDSCRHELHRRRRQAGEGDHGRARRRAVVHRHRQQLDRADRPHQPRHHRVHRLERGRPDQHHHRSRRCVVVHQPRHQPIQGNSTIGRIDPTTHVITKFGASISGPSSITAGPTVRCGSPATRRAIRSAG